MKKMQITLTTMIWMAMSYLKKQSLNARKTKKMKREPAFQKVKCVILPGIHLI